MSPIIKKSNIVLENFHTYISPMAKKTTLLFENFHTDISSIEKKIFLKNILYRNKSD